MSTLRLITSAAYVDQELAVEFGQLPPAFLPIGVSPLYEAQLTHFGQGQPVYLTIPEGFCPQPYDFKRLTELGVSLVPVPLELTLGESIIYAINYIDAPHDIIEILHGDTLIEDIPCGEIDCIAIHSEGDDYSWATVELNSGNIEKIKVVERAKDAPVNHPVACGYFSLGSGRLLVRSITRAKGDFVAGLDLYNKECPLNGAWVSKWRDFGHIQTYFRSRRSISTARSFNTLNVDHLAIRKSSYDKAKVLAEAAWLTKVPPKVKPYCVRVFEKGEISGSGFYSTEYQYAPTLSELLVFSSIGRSTWRNILASCHSFLDACASSVGPETAENVLEELAINKTIVRLEQYARESGFSLTATNVLSGQPMPSLLCISEQIAKLIDVKQVKPQTVMHGDFCFSNILYNSRSARISVIDPRGYIIKDKPSHYGDIRYDLAKFSHSITGCYDYILAGRYNISRNSAHEFDMTIETSGHHSWLEQALPELTIQGLNPGTLEIKALTIALFLAMLPLHADRPDRQIAFIATALRLYNNLDRNLI
jgi:hypothetical protein